MRDLAALTGTDFASAVGDVFEVVDETSESVAIRLVEVVLLGERPPHRQPFSLRFDGPPSSLLAQGIHHLVHVELGELDIFLVPIVSGAGGPTYEAVFT